MVNTNTIISISASQISTLRVQYSIYCITVLKNREDSSGGLNESLTCDCVSVTLLSLMFIIEYREGEAAH